MINLTHEEMRAKALEEPRDQLKADKNSLYVAEREYERLEQLTQKYLKLQHANNENNGSIATAEEYYLITMALIDAQRKYRIKIADLKNSIKALEAEVSA